VSSIGLKRRRRFLVHAAPGRGSATPVQYIWGVLYSCFAEGSLMKRLF
jgi:hypothetical protein